MVLIAPRLKINVDDSVPSYTSERERERTKSVLYTVSSAFSSFLIYLKKKKNFSWVLDVHDLSSSFYESVLIFFRFLIYDSSP